MAVHIIVYQCAYKPRFISAGHKPESGGGDAIMYDVVFFCFCFFFLSIILYAICTGYTVVQSTKQVCTQIREIKEYNIIILMP